jgi:hypothetical protein
MQTQTETITVLMKPLVFDKDHAGGFDLARNALDREAKLVAKERSIPWRYVKRELKGTPDNCVAIYTATVKKRGH